MGSAVFAKNFINIADALTGIRLLPIHHNSFPKGFQHNNHRQIRGNIFLASTWQNIDKRLEEVGPFTVSFLIPHGGTGYFEKGLIEGEIIANILVISEIYKRTASDIVVTNYFSDKVTWCRFEAYLERVEGVLLNKTNARLRIRKLPSAPATLDVQHLFSP